MFDNPRRIAVMTGTRAEYGLLRFSLRELQARDADVQLIVTGAHLSLAHGMTVRQIEADEFPICARVDMELSGDEPDSLVRSMSIGMSGFASVLSELRPDMVVILGDRYEMLAAATAALMLNIPIAHLQGGEITEGAIDESIRHAITKMSYWHLVATEAYAKRIIQLGEEPERVFVVGAPGIDAMESLHLLPREDLARELNLPLDTPPLLVTYHPETLGGLTPGEQVDELIAALQAFPDTPLIISGSNADSGGLIISRQLEAFAKSRPNARFNLSFGSQIYLSAMQCAGALIGNSSSGVIEAPVMGRASVNIGDRQKGRVAEGTVIDCPCEAAAIIRAIEKALSPAFQKKLKPSGLFGTPGQVAPQIATILTSVPIPPVPRKAFYDL